jgi:type II secretory pathway component PulC
MAWNKYIQSGLHWLPAVFLLLFLLLKICSLVASFMGEEQPPVKQEMARKQPAYTEIPELGQSRVSDPPKSLSLPMTSTEKPVEKPPFPRARFVLQGISIDADNKKAYFFDKEKNETRELYLGESIEGYELDEIENNRIHVKGVEEWFYLFPQPEKEKGKP